jgi:hypothetical protein
LLLVVVSIACHLKTVDTSMAACATGQRMLLLASYEEA